MKADETTTLTAPRGGLGMRMLLALILLAFVGGAVLAALLASRWQGWVQRGEPMEMLANGTDPLENAVASMDQRAPVPRPVGVPGSLVVQAARIAELEQRLGRITLAAQAASSNANRAEAILTAFAARRALDAGRSLGYVEGALRLRFGEAQPKAVATIINAADEPVTLADLRLGLHDIDPVARARRDEDWWAGFWREIGGIAVLRRAGTPPAEPGQRLERAYRAIEAGQVDAAIAEMSALPPQARLTRWLEQARRYNEAHRALDVIEAAAILEPRTAPVIDPANAAVTTPPAGITSPTGN
jgi:ABC-type amino acid transport substrate-binding protein